MAAPSILQPDSITDALKPEAVPAAAAQGLARAPSAPAVSAQQIAASPAEGGLAPALPLEGVLPGKAVLNPEIAPKVPEGVARPLAMGEHVLNPDGSMSNEISVTVESKDLNGGRPTLLPSLWIVDGKPTRVNEDQAVELARQSGLRFKSFDSLDAAEKFANDRESAWQNTKPEDASKIEPLWSVPDGEARAAPVEVMSKPATGVLKLTPEIIQRVLDELAKRPKTQQANTDGMTMDDAVALAHTARKASNAGQ